MNSRVAGLKTSVKGSSSIGRSWRGELEHGGGEGAAGEPAGRHRPPQVDHPPILVEEEEVEREAHPEGVDAMAVRDQKAFAGALAAEQREPDEPARKGGRDRNPAPEDLRAFETSEAERFRHMSISAGR